MARFVIFCLLAVCTIGSAFSLKQRVSVSSPIARSQNLIQPRQTTVLKTIATTTSEPEVVASGKEGFLSKFWTEEVKLSVYLAVWYLGNIYCKKIHRLIHGLQNNIYCYVFKI